MGRLGVPVLLSVCDLVVRVCIGRILIVAVGLVGCDEIMSVLSEFAGLCELAAAGEEDRISFSLCNDGVGKDVFLGSFLKQTAHCQANPLEGLRLKGGLTQVI